MADERVITTTATYRVRTMALANDINVFTVHGDLVRIEAGTEFKFEEIVSVETRYPEDT